MFPFSQTVNPAVRSHIDAQTAFMNDMSKSFFRSFQQVFDLNIQLVQTMLEETTLASQQLLSSDRQSGVLNAASRAQPATEKLRAYQQHISRLAADAQVDLARVTEQHVQTTSRTARALADEVARSANEETERGLRKQQETARQFTDPFMNQAEGSAWQAFTRPEGAAGAPMQSAGQQGMSQQAASQQGASQQGASQQGANQQGMGQRAGA